MVDLTGHLQAMDDARALRHSFRAMRVTLECGHLRLMPHIDTVMGLGSLTSCGICAVDADGDYVVRTVVNCEETGTLHESWGRRHVG